MKRVQLFLVLLLIVTAGLNTVMAQGTIIIVPPPTPTPVPDTDGDGLPDTNDLCPTVPGTREDRGCPVTIPNPPADADGDGIPDASDLCPTIPGTQANQGCPVTGQPNEPPPGNPPNEPPLDSGSPDARPDAPPPFVPPHLPTDGCYVTPMQDSRVNVRNAPDLSAAIIGSLLPGTVYPSLGYVMNGTDMWFVMSVYEGSTRYASRSVLLSSMCAEVPGEVSIPTGAVDDFAGESGEGQAIVFVGGWGSSMYQYAFNDPDLACADPAFTGGVFVAADDVIVDGRIITAENWSSPCFNFTEVVFERAAEGLSLNLRQTDIGETTRSSDGTTTVEYCIYVELYEVGVFNQVCYEIEIPPNCALTTSEAGVYTVVCEGDGVVQLNPEMEGLPALDLTVPSRETPNDPFYMELGDIKG